MTGVKEERLFAALDGGGSSTRAVLFDASGKVLSLATGGASNPNDVGEEASARLLANLLLRAGADRAERIFCGVSGATGHEKKLEQALEAVFPGRAVTVRSDIFNLLSRLPSEDGAALVCGTGSVCFVRHGGVLTRVGGWGWLIDGDCGGGYALARAGLEAAYAALDGRGPETSLLAAAEEFLGGRPDEKLGKIYEGGKPFIASFSPNVAAAAASGDAAALSAVKRTAAGLAGYLRVALRELGEGFSCVCGGGLFEEPFFRRSFLFAVAQAGLPAGLDFVSGPPIAGAAAAALKESGISPDAGFFGRFEKDYRFLESRQ
ncbi:MAG: hypothetical protein J6V01_07100 [Clostridia bacterium]|nr:hypothetical protein [Clostridia bacterium]